MICSNCGKTLEGDEKHVMAPAGSKKKCLVMIPLNDDYEDAKLGRCVRCLTPKGDKDDPDMCATCHKEIDEAFKKLEETLP